MKLCHLSLLFCWLVGPTTALFPGTKPDEGDYRHFYPIVNVAIYSHPSYGHTLPYIFGLLEGLRYPKDRIRVDFLVDAPLATEKDGSGESTAESLIEKYTYLHAI